MTFLCKLLVYFKLIIMWLGDCSQSYKHLKNAGKNRKGSAALNMLRSMTSLPRHAQSH